MKTFNSFLNEKYYLQPDGTWKKNGDGRSEGMTRAELIKAGKASKIREMSHKDLADKFKGKTTSMLQKMAADNRKYSPVQRKEIEKEIKMRSQVREETGGGAMPASGNTTRSGPGMGDDSTLHTKKARLMKKIYRRFHTTKDQTKIGVK